VRTTPQAMGDRKVYATSTVSSKACPSEENLCKEVHPEPECDIYIYIYVICIYIYIYVERERERVRGGVPCHGEPLHGGALYTLHPTPYTLRPTPYALHPTPYTLHPTPDALRPTLYAPHPTLYTSNPTPYTLKPNNPTPPPRTTSAWSCTPSHPFRPYPEYSRPNSDP